METPIELSTTLTSVSKYEDPLNENAILRKAKEHGMAQLVSDIPISFQGEKVEFCECCQLPVRTPGIIDPFPYCVDIKKFSQCGVGTFLYFFFIKFIILCLLIILIMTIIPTIILSYSYSTHLIDYCTNKNITGCERYFNKTITNDWLHRISYLNYQEMIRIQNDNNLNNVVDYSYINCCTIVCLMIVNFLFIILMNNYIKEADYDQITPSDFTLMVSNVKRDFTDTEELKKMLKINDVTPSEINLTYSLDQFFESSKALSEAKRFYKICKEKNLEKCSTGFMTVKSRFDLKSEIIKHKQIIKDYEQIEENHQLGTFTGVIFATFENCSDYCRYIYKFPKSFLGKLIKNLNYVLSKYMCCCCYSLESKRRIRDNFRFRVENAPEPMDVIWENLQYNIYSRLRRSALVYFICLILNGISLFIIVILNRVQFISERDNWTNNTFAKYSMSTGISIVISIFNQMISISMYKLSEYEKHQSLTKFQLSLSNKMTSFLFINTAIVPLYSNIINGISTNILINNLLIIFLSNSIITPLYTFVNVSFVLKSITRSKIERKFTENEEIPSLTQKELNEIYENPDIQISYKYSYLNLTFLLTVFYIPLFPIGTILSLIGITLMYIIEKYNLLNTYRRPQMMSSDISRYYIGHFTIFLFFYALGLELFFDNLFPSTHNINHIMLAILSLFILLPFEEIFECDFIGFIENEFLLKTHSQCYLQFSTDYERQNPITRRIGCRNYLKKLKELNLITDDQYINMLDKMEKEKINMIEIYYRTNADVNLKKKNNELFKLNQMLSKSSSQINNDLKIKEKTKNYGSLANLFSKFIPMFEIMNKENSKVSKKKNVLSQIISCEFRNSSLSKDNLLLSNEISEKNNDLEIKINEEDKIKSSSLIHVEKEL